MANIYKAIFSSRKTLLIIFAIVFAIGIWILKYFKGNSVAEGIGGSLIASAIVSLATIWIDQIRSGEQLRANQLLESGLRHAYPSRALDDYENHLTSFSSIDVCGYTLVAFTESNESRMREKAKKGDSFKVRMLLVDPRCSAAVLLEEAENKSEGTYAKALKTTQMQLIGLEKHVEIRLLQRSLPMMIYRIDNVLYTGPYPHIGASRNAITLKLEGGWLFKRQQDEFESLWVAAKPIDREVGVA